MRHLIPEDARPAAWDGVRFQHQATEPAHDRRSWFLSRKEDNRHGPGAGYEREALRPPTTARSAG